MGYFALAGFVLGLLLGSFLNVCIARLPKHESVVSPGSRCLACGHPIRWYDNIPLLSWLMLRGKCRDCGTGISWQYPTVELGTGVWFALVGGQLWHAWFVSGFGGIVSRAPDAGVTLSILAAGFAILGFLLIGLTVMDWQTLLLPDAFTLTGIAAGIFLVCVQAIFLAPGEGQIILDSAHQLRLSSPGSFASQGNIFLTGPEALIFGRIAAIAGAALLLLGVRWAYKAVRKRDGMGLGDVKLLAMIAAFLGFGQSLLALLLGAVAASCFGIILMLRGKAGAASKLPFGSFLAVGGLAAGLFGLGLVGWYLSLLR
jgi:leader peptidase (prepilin peptidase) / N-methyltransferase